MGKLRCLIIIFEFLYNYKVREFIYKRVSGLTLVIDLLLYFCFRGMCSYLKVVLYIGYGLKGGLRLSKILNTFRHKFSYYIKT